MIRGWIAYYSHFYKTQLRPTLKRIDAYVIRKRFTAHTLTAAEVGLA
jgi:group II intron maturase